MSRGRRLLWLGIAGGGVLLALGYFFLFVWKNPGRPYDTSKNNFDGSSEELEQTAVVPTLDTPIPDRKSAIWCSSFQLAWNHLKANVAQEPIQLQGAEAVAARLNRAEQTDSDLNAEDFYAAAGFVKNGIVQRIHTEMRLKFPDIPAPALPDGGALAYAFMRTQVKFEHLFQDNVKPFQFTDSAGRRVALKSFGIIDGLYGPLYDQVQILYCPKDTLKKGEKVDEFVVDPCKYSEPYQIILACISRKPTLAEAVADVDRKVAEKPPRPPAIEDSLLIPVMHWRVTHRFKELEGKEFLNPTLKGLYLNMAYQMTRFRLDRSGAELTSESRAIILNGVSTHFHFHFNRPFLVIMKKRDGKQPFFVMWVDNAELLEK